MKTNNTKALFKIILIDWCKKNGEKIQEEYKFWPGRRFKFDYYLPDLKTGIEYEGLMSSKSRHTTVTGYSNDCIKYNEAAKMGIKVLRYTVINYAKVIDDLTQLKIKP